MRPLDAADESKRPQSQRPMAETGRLGDSRRRRELMHPNHAGDAAPP
jgi:hypothetical protein